MKQPIVPGVKTKSLKQARRNFIRRSKRNLMIMVDVDLRNGWFVRGYCYMTAKKLAAAISERLGLTTPLTPKQIKMRRLALELHTKRNSGPEPV